jgi:hypothetical protein
LRKEIPVRLRFLAKVLSVLGGLLFVAPAFATVQRTMIVEEFGWWF